MVESQPSGGKVYFYVTGFGKFGNILENPTTHLVKALPDLLKAAAEKTNKLELKSTEIVVVAMKYCDEAIERMYTLVDQEHDNADHHIVINFGVAAGRPKFSLEKIGKNIKDFRIPDENGDQPRDACIDDQCDITSCLETTLQLEKIRDNLEALGHNVEVSQNAGEYICNYAFYKNIMKCKSFCTEKSTSKVHALFVHVPSFETIEEPKQQAFVVDMLAQMAE